MNVKLEVNSSAPNFSLSDQNGKIHSLDQYKGKWVLLYFYPKDFTSGCTTEACGFRDKFQQLKSEVNILGVSADTVASHAKFAEEHGLQFTLLSDPDKKTIGKYGADGLIFTKRTSFLINPDGKIAKIYSKVTPDSHAEEILEDLRKMKGNA